jgi:hypothetical protein
LCSWRFEAPRLVGAGGLGCACRVSLLRGQSGGGHGVQVRRSRTDRVRVDRAPRTGVVEEVVHGTADPRYRIRWDDGPESIYTPAAGTLQTAEPGERGVGDALAFLTATTPLRSSPACSLLRTRLVDRAQGLDHIGRRPRESRLGRSGRYRGLQRRRHRPRDDLDRLASRRAGGSPAGSRRRPGRRTCPAARGTAHINSRRSRHAGSGGPAVARGEERRRLGRAAPRPPPSGS